MLIWIRITFCQEFVSSGYEAQTVDFLIINAYSGQLFSIVWLDEALLGHPGIIELIRRKLRPVRVKEAEAAASLLPSNQWS
jgi:hypothetical protein